MLIFWAKNKQGSYRVSIQVDRYQTKAGHLHFAASLLVGFLLLEDIYTGVPKSKYHLIYRL
jgi:hypothetical protein